MLAFALGLCLFSCMKNAEENLPIRQSFVSSNDMEVLGDVFTEALKLNDVPFYCNCDCAAVIELRTANRKVLGDETESYLNGDCNVVLNDFAFQCVDVYQDKVNSLILAYEDAKNAGYISSSEQDFLAAFTNDMANLEAGVDFEEWKQASMGITNKTEFGTIIIANVVDITAYGSQWWMDYADGDGSDPDIQGRWRFSGKGLGILGGAYLGALNKLIDDWGEPQIHHPDYGQCLGNAALDGAKTSLFS